MLNFSIIYVLLNFLQLKKIVKIKISIIFKFIFKFKSKIGVLKKLTILISLFSFNYQFITYQRYEKKNHI